MTMTNPKEFPPKLFVDSRDFDNPNINITGVLAEFNIENCKKDGIYYAYIPEVESASVVAARVAEARAEAFDEIGDWLNVAHTQSPELFPDFGDEKAWGGANHFKVYAANALWKMADTARLPRPRSEELGGGES